jgi:hypothetical protein
VEGGGMTAIRYKANLAEEDPDGNLVGVEAITEAEQRIEELYEEGTELFDAAEALARAVETTKQPAKVLKALEHFRTVTGG